MRRLSAFFSVFVPAKSVPATARPTPATACLQWPDDDAFSSNPLLNKIHCSDDQNMPSQQRKHSLLRKRIHPSEPADDPPPYSDSQLETTPAPTRLPAQGLDRIDELDEASLLPVHLPGPYDAVRRALQPPEVGCRFYSDIM
jgi:hypothetical protein